MGWDVAMLKLESGCSTGILDSLEPLYLNSEHGNYHVKFAARLL